MSNILVAIIGVVTAAVAGAATWLGLKLRYNGRIDTTEAATLWAESQGMRHELRDQVEAGNVALKAKEAEAQENYAKWQDCEAVNLALRRELLDKDRQLRQQGTPHDE